MMNQVLEQIHIHPVRSKILQRSEGNMHEENDHESRCGSNIENHLIRG